MQNNLKITDFTKSHALLPLFEAGVNVLKLKRESINIFLITMTKTRS